MNNLVVGILTNGVNNMIDNIFNVLLFSSVLRIEKKNRKWLFLYFFIVKPLTNVSVYIWQNDYVIVEGVYQLTILFEVTILPIIVARSEMLKYVLAHSLNAIVVSIVSFGVYGICGVILQSDKLYFYTENVADLPAWLWVNVLYASLSYGGYKLCKIIMKGYKPNSKVQNGMGIFLLIVNHLSETIIFYTLISGKMKMHMEFVLAFVAVSLLSLEAFLLILYQNKQMNQDKVILQRHREKELEYYRKLENNQIRIRKMRHDMLNYLKTVEYLADNEKNAQNLLEDLEKRVEEL